MNWLGRVIGVATELGVTMGLMAAGLVVLGLWLGRRIDAALGTSPLATIVFILAGVVVGQVAIFRLAMRSLRSLSEDVETVVQPKELVSDMQGLWVLVLVLLPALFCLGLGIWIDRKLGTGGIATLALASLGLLGGFVGSLRLAHSSRRHGRREKDETCTR